MSIGTKVTNNQSQHATLLSGQGISLFRLPWLSLAILYQKSKMFSKTPHDDMHDILIDSRWTAREVCLPEYYSQFGNKVP